MTPTQLKKLDKFIAERARLASIFDTRLEALDWITPPIRPPELDPAWQAYVAMVDPKRSPKTRNEILAHLQSRGIAGRPGTHSVVGLEAYRKKFDTNPASFPVTTHVEANSIALPLHNHMTDADVDRVVDALEELA